MSWGLLCGTNAISINIYDRQQHLPLSYPVGCRPLISGLEVEVEVEMMMTTTALR